MQHIDSINCTYYIRAKTSTTIRINNYSDADLINSIDDIPVFFSKSSFFDSVYITKDNFHTKLTVSKSDSHKEPYYILTNGNTRDAVKHYSKRFGSTLNSFLNLKRLMGFILNLLKFAISLPSPLYTV